MTTVRMPEAHVAELAEQIRALFAKNPPPALPQVRELLAARLGDCPPEQGRAVIRQLIDHFGPVQRRPAAADSEIMTRVFGLILGRKVAPDDLSSSQVLERLAQSLNTIFDALNELIGRIDSSFSSEDAGSGEQTIRQVIGFHIEGDGDRIHSLEQYLGRINQAFLTTHEAFKAAARTKVEQIIQAVDPDNISSERSGLKIGPLRKAQDFDILKEKIERIRRWFDSGRFMQDFLREFEKNCQALTRK